MSKEDNQSKHTPRPWYYDGSNYIFTTEGNKMIAEIRGYGSGEPMDANGKLMSAAPDLLEVVKEVEWIERGWCGNCDRVDYSQCCPLCKRDKEQGHSEDCELSAALKRVEG